MLNILGWRGPALATSTSAGDLWNGSIAMSLKRGMIKLHQESEIASRVQIDMVTGWAKKSYMETFMNVGPM
jgi:hypothetical protein